MLSLSFKTSKLYCKYVISILSNSIKKINVNNETYNEIDDKLYESYLKLEKILELEFSNF